MNSHSNVLMGKASEPENFQLTQKRKPKGVAVKAWGNDRLAWLLHQCLFFKRPIIHPPDFYIQYFHVICLLPMSQSVEGRVGELFE